MHELFLCLLEEEVPLVRLSAAVVVERAQEETAEKVLKDVRDAILKSCSVKEGEEEIAHVCLVDSFFLAEVLLQLLLIALHDVQLPLHGVRCGCLPSLGGLILEVLIPSDVVDLPDDFAHE